MSHLFWPSTGGEAACFRAVSSAFPLLLLFKLGFDPDALTPLTASAPLIVAADMFEYHTCTEGKRRRGARVWRVSATGWSVLKALRRASPCEAARSLGLLSPCDVCAREEKKKGREGGGGWVVVTAAWWWWPASRLWVCNLGEVVADSQDVHSWRSVRALAPRDPHPAALADWRSGRCRMGRRATNVSDGRCPKTVTRRSTEGLYQVVWEVHKSCCPERGRGARAMVKTAIRCDRVITGTTRYIIEQPVLSSFALQNRKDGDWRCMGMCWRQRYYRLDLHLSRYTISISIQLVYVKMES